MSLAGLTLAQLDEFNSPVGLEGLNFFDKFLGGDQNVLTDEKREAALQDCNAPLTIVRVGKLIDQPGGASDIQIAQVEDVTSTAKSHLR